MLNVSRPAVLRQYYGRDFDAYSSNLIVKRYTHGYCSVQISVGTDINNFIIKPFNINPNKTSKYITILCRSYMNKLGFCNMNFT